MLIVGFYPFKIKNQIIEPGIQMYSGYYTMNSDQISAASGTRTATKVNATKEYLDERMAATLVLYPKPFGIQAEYNIGKGPEYDITRDSIMVKDLSGGYVTLNWMIKIKKQIIFPYVRGTMYKGGKKHELDARSYEVMEIEGGIEWQPMKNFEFVVAYMYSDRMASDRTKEKNYQFGQLIRLHAQVNF